MSTSSFRVSYIIELTISEGSVVMSSVGHITRRSSCFFVSDSTSVTSLGSPFSYPPRYPAMASMGARVADRPILVNSVSQSSRRRSIVRERNAPLLESHMSCISSSISHSTWVSFSLNFGASRISARDSGVVIRMWGGCFSIFCLSYWDVSPDLTATLMLGGIMPLALATSLISFRGVFRLRLISLARAFRGEMYMQYMRSSSVPSLS